MTDLCSTCQQNTAKLQCSMHLPNEEKSVCVRSQQEHTTRAKANKIATTAHAAKLKKILTLYGSVLTLRKFIHPVRLANLCTTPFIIHNKSIYQLTQCNPALYPLNTT